MSKKEDEALAAGVRARRKPSIIDADVHSSTVLAQMHADAMSLPLALIHRSPYQVRQVKEDEVEEIMASIADTGGLITPIVVRPLETGGYELIAGHTRWEAYSRLGYADIPAVVRPLTDAEAGRALAADNLARKDLTDYEIYKQLRELFARGFLKSNSEAARLLGRVRQDIIRYRAFEKLPTEVLDLLETKPELLGGTTVQVLADYPADRVIAGCHKLAQKVLRTQQDLEAWLARPHAAPAVRNERRVLDLDGKTVGRISRAATGIRVSGKGVDLGALERAVEAELARQGLRF